jgi:CelD/BcsL family acetyltransferase involved in cellulose biosynthesis
MQVEQVNDFQHFKSIQREWNAFVQQCEWSSISHRHEWLTCWWEAFGGNAAFRLLILREDGRLVGVLPLMLKREWVRALPIRVLSLTLNGHTPEAGILLQNSIEEPLHHLLAALKNTQNEWDLLRLEKLRRTIFDTNSCKESMASHGFHYLYTESLNSPYAEIGSDWDQFYLARSKKFRKVMRNKLNRMERDGLLRLEHLSGTAVTGNVLEEIFAASKRSWKGRVNRAIPDDPRVESFYKNLTAAFAANGSLDVWLLRRDGKLAAFEYHLRHRGVVYPLRADFDSAYHALSPGSVLEFFIMRSLFEDPTIHGFNSCGATYDYLMNWATEVIERVELRIFNSRRISKELFLLESKILPLAKKLKLYQSTGARQ